MKTLTAAQAELAGRRTLKPIPLVVITTYTDVEAGTVDDTHYFSDRSVVYDWANSGTLRHFLPFIVDVDPIARQIPHLSSPQSGGLLLQNSLSFRMRNGELDGSGETFLQSLEKHVLIDSGTATGATTFALDDSGATFADNEGYLVSISSGTGAGQIRTIINDATTSLNIYDGWTTTPVSGSGYEIWRPQNLVGALVEIAELLIDPLEPVTSTRDLVGSEHIVFYRGYIRHVRENNGVLNIDLQQKKLSLDWLILNEDDQSAIDPIMSGKRANVVYGNLNGIRCQGVEVGVVDLLASPVSDTDTIFQVADIDAFPTTGTGRIGLETFTWTGKNAANSTLTGITRGVSSTKARAYSGGALIAESITEAAFLIANHVMEDVTSIYARNPLDHRLLRLEPGTHGNVSLDDADSLVSGDWASFKISSAQMLNMQTYFEGQAAYESSTDPDPAIDTEALNNIGGAITNDANSSLISSANNGDATDIGGNAWRLHHSSLISTSAECIVIWVTGLTGNPIDRISEWRIRMTITAATDTGSPVRNVSSRIYLQNSPLFSNGPSETVKLESMKVESGTSSPYTQTEEVVSPWYVVDEAAFLYQDDFNGTINLITPSFAGFFVIALLEVEGIPTPDSDRKIEIDLDDAYIEFKPFDTSDVSRVASANTLTRISAGQGLEIFADGSGITAPDANYQAASGAVLSDIGDILHHLLVERAGVAFSELDSTSWTAYEDETSLNDSAYLNQDFGESFEEVIGRLCFEGRVQMIQDETNSGRTWKLLFGQRENGALYSFDRSGRIITEWQSIQIESREADDIYTRWVILSEPNRPLLDAGRSDPTEIFTTTDRMDPVQSDVVNISSVMLEQLESRRGRNDREPIFIVSATDPAWAREVVGYLAAECLRDRALIIDIRGVPWVQGYDIEMGDIVQIALPEFDEGNYPTVRVLGFSKQWDTGLIDIVGIEVNGK